MSSLLILGSEGFPGKEIKTKSDILNTKLKEKHQQKASRNYQIRQNRKHRPK